ncbi:glycoside hydrolase family 88/105 protein [Cohnella thermotolerans]|uniref:glycoside hydrolase family 88/105 protein n=1 Tax=Cohnella thermotolerans TaxID=329858 RepID=UPI0004069296|nr:glycoside hydrolase family 88 protein [Cohnella thermotolerans]
MANDLMERSRLAETADRVYRRMTDMPTKDWGMNLEEWDWVPGVGLISILAYTELGEKSSAIDDLRGWIDRNKHKAGESKTINAMAPYAVFPELYRRTGDAWYLETARRIGDWMVKEAPRTREMAFEHTVTEDVLFPEQVWADTVFMAVLFLARLARLTGDRRYAEEAAFQLRIHLQLLQDPDTGLLFHGWNCGSGDHMSSAYWTRANAWVVLAAPWIAGEIAGMMEIPGDIVHRYQRLAEALRGYQGENGLWPTVADHPHFYPETSGSAGIAAGWFAGNAIGWLDDSYLDAAQKTLNGVLAQVAPDGTVTGVSGGTPVMPSIAAYNEIPCYPTLYGQGLTLILLSYAWARAGQSERGETGVKNKMQ